MCSHMLGMSGLGIAVMLRSGSVHLNCGSVHLNAWMEINNTNTIITLYSLIIVDDEDKCIVHIL